MIKELEYEEIMAFQDEIEREKSLNLFFRNNLKLYKYKRDYNVFMTEGLLLMHLKRSAFILLKYAPFDEKEVASFILQKKPIMINGPKYALSPLEKELGEGWKKKYLKMMDIDRSSFKKVFPRSDNLSLLLTYSDFLSAAKLHSRDEEFGEGLETKEKREAWAEKKEEEMEYPFAAVGYKVGGKLVGTAFLSSATKESAMVVGVFVDKEWRGKGIGTMLTEEITDIGLNEHRINKLCLFPSEKKAESIYSRLGYMEAGEYAYFRNLSI